jgi:hypothetical protein
MNPSESWTDERISERFAGVDRELVEQHERLNAHRRQLDLMQDTGVRIVALDGRVQMIAEDTVECRDGIKELRQQQTASAEKAATALQSTADALKAWQLEQVNAKLAEREQMATDNRAMRKFIVTTCIAVAGLLLTAGGILAAVLT